MRNLRRLFRVLLAVVSCVLLCGHTEHAAAQQVRRPPAEGHDKLLAEGIKDLAADILAKVTQEQKHRVAVLPFREISGRKTILDPYLSEALLTELIATGKIEVVERAMLDKILAEVKLGKSGLIDSATARHLGKVAGVDAIVTGTITELRTSLAVNCRLIDAQTGLVFSAAQARILKEDDVMTLLAQKETGSSETPGSDEARPPDGSVAAGHTATRKGPEASMPGKGPRPPVASEREQGFTFDLLECRGEGSVIACDLRITNRMSDRWLWLHSGYGSRTYLVDAQGNTCAAQKGSFEWGTLPRDVPLRVTLQFANCPRNATELSYLELGLQLGNPAFGDQFKVPFRQRIPIVNK